MAWNNNYAFKILADMPTRLNSKNLEYLQSEIDKDKLATSIEMNRDLCGAYAPFCAFCDKSEKFPCAVALIKYKQTDGLQFEIAVAEEEIPAAESGEEAIDAPVSEAEKSEEKPSTGFDGVVAPVVEEPAVAAENAEQPVPPPVKKKIRIAIAKRKH